MKPAVLLVLVPLVAGALAASAPAGASDPELESLVGWMSGSFTSAAQAAADSAYYDIRLEMVRVWPERDDAAWLYVEQAVAGAQERPYRQRIYRVRRFEDDLFQSAVFELPDPAAVVGAWKAGDPLRGLSPDDLELREGCAVFLRRDPLGAYSGGTVGRGCGSTLRGATYATSEVVVTPGRVESWDRGFDAEGVQVWGAEEGPYVFLREGE